MEKWINQTLKTGLVVIFHSLFKEKLLQTLFPSLYIFIFSPLFYLFPQLLKCRKSQKILV